MQKPNTPFLIVIGKYEYHITDHLGNVRVTFTKSATGSAELIQAEAQRRFRFCFGKDHYYPFGLQMSGQHFENTTFLNKYLYNEKQIEAQRRFRTCFGTGYFDYGFRQLDPQLCRWHVVDAMAEKYLSTSPYAYVENNPISFTDYMGLWSFPVYFDGVYGGYISGEGNDWSGASFSGGGGSFRNEREYMNIMGGALRHLDSGLSSVKGKDMFGTFWSSMLGRVIMRLGGYKVGLFGSTFTHYIKDKNYDEGSWNPSDPTKGHFAPDFKTLVNYMYENSPKEKREFAAWVIEKDGKEYYYLENRDDSSPCECWPTFQGNGKVALDFDGNGIKELFNIIIGIHTHNSCIGSRDYQGPSYDDYEAATDFKANSLIIGPTEISFLFYEKYYSEKYFLDLFNQKNKLIENPFYKAYTLDWLLNPTYKFK